MEVSETLNLAADLIEERGWASGQGWENCQSPDQPLCLEGGIAAAMGMNHALLDGLSACPAYKAVREYLQARGDKAPFIWNDNLKYERIMAAIERGEASSREGLGGIRAEAEEWAKTQVLSVLRACAVIEAAKESPALELAAPVAAVSHV